MSEILESKELVLLGGVSWFDAPRPPLRHKCWPQSRGWDRGMRFERCACGAISLTAVVGWGKPPRWICLEHFNRRLKRVRELVDEARQL